MKPRRRGVRKPTVSEDKLHLAVAQYLTWALRPPAWWTTFPLGGGGAVRGARLKAKGTKAGVPDILVVAPKRPLLWIELKTTTGVVSDEQEECHEHLVAAGCQVVVARDLDDVAAALAAAGLRDVR